MASRADEHSCGCDGGREAFTHGAAIVGGAVGIAAATHLLPFTLATGAAAPATALALEVVGATAAAYGAYKLAEAICDTLEDAGIIP